MAHLTSSAELIERVLRPDPTVVWRIALTVAALLTGLGLLGPPVAPGLGLAVIVGLSVVAGQERLTARLTGLAMVASVLLGVPNLTERGVDPAVLLTHLGLLLLILLTGVAGCLAVRRISALAFTEAKLMSPISPLAPELPGGQQVLERAAEVLAQLSGAANFTVQRVENVSEFVSGMDAVRPEQRRRSPLNAAPPVHTDPVLWIRRGGEVLVRLVHPGHSEALISLYQPRTPLGFIEDATRVLQMQVERAALLQEVHQQRELLRDLVYAFSHDLRTPITASILNTQAALYGAFGPLTEEFQTALRSSLEAHQGLLAISDQLMLLAEYESGGPVGDESATVDLAPVLRTVLDDLSSRASTNALHLELTLEHLSVRGHRYDLRRVFQNLLDNAVKFSPPSSVICVRLRREGTLVVIEVCDRGPGVAPEQEKWLFQRFRQTASGSGTGIGLYLTRRIVERHGGRLAYTREPATEDQLGQTTFSVSLPHVERT